MKVNQLPDEIADFLSAMSEGGEENNLLFEDVLAIDGVFFSDSDAGEDAGGSDGNGQTGMLVEAVLNNTPIWVHRGHTESYRVKKGMRLYTLVIGREAFNALQELVRS